MTALLIGMLGFGTTAMAETTATQPSMNNIRPGAPCEPGMWRHRGNAGFRMNQMLKLSAEQRTRFIELRRNHFDQSITGRRELTDLKRELAHESLKKTPDQKKIDALADNIGREHTKLARTQSRFFAELSAILTPEQMQTFLKMKERRFPGRNS
ncbi:MAG: periplasmic heavy metal sensor [Chlorobiaceae bacterium]|nr:periplasmic heavy metal sensor [Chlorobiaceae bacterium]